MNLKNMEVKKALGDELNDLEDALRSDDVIVPVILKLLRYRLRGCRPSLKMLKSPSYPFERAARDGAQYELDWLINILREDLEE